MDRALWAFCRVARLSVQVGLQHHRKQRQDAWWRTLSTSSGRSQWCRFSPPTRHATTCRHIGELTGREAAPNRVFTGQRRVTRPSQNVVARPLILSRIPPAKQKKFPRTLHHVCSS